MKGTSSTLHIVGSSTTVLLDAKGDPMSVSTTSFELTLKTNSIEVVDMAEQAGVREPAKLPIGFALPLIRATAMPEASTMWRLNGPSQRFLSAEARS